tara:strand:- start:3422 stop:3778 length:357 start_codon:yes stop_codon:yes gene_type:complete
MANSVEAKGGDEATLRAWASLSANERANNPGKSRGLRVWLKQLVTEVAAAGYEFTDADGVAMTPAKRTRFLTKARKNLKLNLIVAGKSEDDAEESTKIGGSNFLKIDELVPMDTSGWN